MIEQRSGQYCQAVSESAPYLPEPRRGEMLRKALALRRRAVKISYSEAPGDALKELVPFLPRSLHGKVLWVRIRTSWGKPGLTMLRNGWQLQVRNRLRGSVPDVLLRWTISVKRVLGTEKRGWAATLGRLAPYMSEPLLRETLAMVQQVEDPGARSLALAKLAPCLAKSGDFQQALEAARAAYGWCRAKAFADLMRYLPKELKSQALHETLEAIEGLWDCREPNKRDLLLSLLSCAPGQFDLDALNQILPVVMGLKWAENSEPVLKKLARHLIAAPTPTLIRFWTKEYRGIGFLHVLSCCSRPYLLSCIGALAPLIAALGGSEAAAEAFQAIQDVKRWW